MIRQYLSNTNESATVSIFQKILELNKAETTITKAPVVSIVLAPFHERYHPLPFHFHSERRKGQQLTSVFKVR